MQEHDYRLKLIESRIGFLYLVIPVVSPKGGVGKTTISSALALLLVYRNVPTALLDLDITNPTAHIFLGIDLNSVQPYEDRGIVPPYIDRGLEFMSIAFFSRDSVLPLRGKYVVNVIREIFAITRWRNRVLIIDMPPGFSDPMIEIIRFARKLTPLVISTCDKLSIMSSKRLLRYLKDRNIEILGIIGNMCRENDDKAIIELSQEFSIDYLGSIKPIEDLHIAYGYPEKILQLLNNYLDKAAKKVIKLYEGSNT